jgi:chaperone BCS1
VVIKEKDSLSIAVAHYLAQRYMLKRGSRFVSAKSDSSDNDSDTRENDASYDASSGIQYLPSVGPHWFLFGYWPFMFEQRRGDNELTLDQTVNGVKPTKDDVDIVIRCIGWSAAPLRSFLASIQKWAEQQNEMRAVTEVRVPYVTKEWLGHWRHAKFIMSRPLSTIELDAEIKDPVVKDISTFLSPAARQYYKEQGIPYRRGYLLHGPPGTGKSSLARALAGHFRLTLCVISLSSEGMTGTVLTALFDRLPKRCIVVLEDIDSAGIKTRAELNQIAAEVKATKGKKSDEAEGITLADLLNVLDGTIAAEGRILILTTNTPDVLDSAMIRAGRIDRQVPMLQMSKASACSIFKRMFAKAEVGGGELPNLAERFASKLPEGQITAAEVQGFLLDHRDDPIKAADGVEEWVNTVLKAREKRLKILEDNDKKSDSTGNHTTSTNPIKNPEPINPAVDATVEEKKILDTSLTSEPTKLLVNGIKT